MPEKKSTIRKKSAQKPTKKLWDLRVRSQTPAQRKLTLKTLILARVAAQNNPPKSYYNGDWGPKNDKEIQTLIEFASAGVHGGND